MLAEEHPPSRHLRRRAHINTLIATPVMMLVALAGCAQHGDGPAMSDPGDVAVQYTVELYSTHSSQASSLILPASRSDFLVLVNLLAARKLSSAGLRAGAVVVTGNAATVTILGTLCSAPRAASPPSAPHSAAPTCVSNSDAASSNAGFRVSLLKAPDGRWYVYLPVPQHGPEQSGGATPPPLQQPSTPAVGSGSR